MESAQHGTWHIINTYKVLTLVTVSSSYTCGQNHKKDYEQSTPIKPIQTKGHVFVVSYSAKVCVCVTIMHIGLQIGNQKATVLAVVESVLLILEVQELKGREVKRPKKQDINAEAGTVTFSPDSQPSASLFGCTS